MRNKQRVIIKFVAVALIVLGFIQKVTLAHFGVSGGGVWVCEK